MSDILQKFDESQEPTPKKPFTVQDWERLNEAMERAPQWVACYFCDGTKKIYEGIDAIEPTTCPKCRGEGRIRR